MRLRRAIDQEKPVARMEWSGIRESCSTPRSFLDYASLHPGYILLLKTAVLSLEMSAHTSTKAMFDTARYGIC